MATAQFDSKLGYPLKAGDTRYTIAYAAPIDNSINRYEWLKSLSAGTGDAKLFTGATFTGTSVLLIANKTNFDAGVLAADGVEVV